MWRLLLSKAKRRKENPFFSLCTPETAHRFNLILSCLKSRLMAGHVLVPNLNHLPERSGALWKDDEKQRESSPCLVLLHVSALLSVTFPALQQVLWSSGVICSPCLRFHWNLPLPEHEMLHCRVKTLISLKQEDFSQISCSSGDSCWFLTASLHFLN